jgi:hypothetical protein
MSLFSYIAFPRPVDKSCLKSAFDKSKAFTVGEIRGTDLEKQIPGGISDQLPDNVNVYLGDMSDFWGMNIFDKRDESFQNTFKNEFIYCLEADFNFGSQDEFIRQSMEIYRNSAKEERGGQTEAEFMEFARQIADDKKARAALCRQQLYDIFQLNVKPNESIEIYSVWLGENSGAFAPPTEIRVIDITQVLSSDLLDLQEYVKLEISRMNAS